MPGIDDFADLVGELEAMGGAEQVEPATENAEQDTTESLSEEPSTEPVEQQESTTDQESTEPAAQQQPQEDKTARAFAQMRTQLSSYEKAIKRAAQAAGVTPEQFLNDIENRALHVTAKQQGITPEILQRLEHAEAAARSYELEAAKVRVQGSLANLQAEFNLNQTELQSFVQECITKQIDISDPQLDVSTLYRGMNFSKLMEKERQAWIAKDSANRSKSSAPIGSNGKAPSSNDKVESMEDLEAMLSEIQ